MEINVDSIIEKLLAVANPPTLFTPTPPHCALSPTQCLLVGEGPATGQGCESDGAWCPPHTLCPPLSCSTV